VTREFLAFTGVRSRDEPCSAAILRRFSRSILRSLFLSKSMTISSRLRCGREQEMNGESRIWLNASTFYRFNTTKDVRGHS